MLLVNEYVHFLTDFKDTSALGLVRRWLNYKMFHKVSVGDLCEIYKWNLYKMLNDFVFLYSRIDLFFKLANNKKLKEYLFLDMRRVDINSEAYLLKDYTIYYTLNFPNLKLTWNDKDEEVEGEGLVTRVWNPNNIHTGLMIDTTAHIINFMNQLLDEYWNVPEKDLNYQSVYILSLGITNMSLNSSSVRVDKDFYIDLKAKCTYLHINDHKYLEFIPVMIQVDYKDKLYTANIKLSVTYINYRFEYLKTTYNPYVIDFIEQHKDKIVQMIKNMITEISEIQ